MQRWGVAKIGAIPLSGKYSMKSLAVRVKLMFYNLYRNANRSVVKFGYTSVEGGRNAAGAFLSFVSRVHLGNLSDIKNRYSERVRLSLSWYTTSFALPALNEFHGRISPAKRVISLELLCKDTSDNAYTIPSI